jgi:hypothetical protein
MSSDASPAPIVIIGAGVSGCISALLLSKFAPVLLFERETEQMARQEARSINVTMCERGLSVFARVDELRGTTLREDLLSKGVGLSGRLIHTGAGGLVPQPYGRPGQAIYSMRRSLLVKTCRETVEKFISNSEKGTPTLPGPIAVPAQPSHLYLRSEKWIPNQNVLWNALSWHRMVPIYYWKVCSLVFGFCGCSRHFCRQACRWSRWGAFRC